LAVQNPTRHCKGLRAQGQIHHHQWHEDMYGAY